MKTEVVMGWLGCMVSPTPMSVLSHPPCRATAFPKSPTLCHVCGKLSKPHSPHANLENSSFSREVRNNCLYDVHLKFSRPVSRVLRAQTLDPCWTWGFKSQVHNPHAVYVWASHSSSLCLGSPFCTIEIIVSPSCGGYEDQENSQVTGTGSAWGLQVEYVMHKDLAKPGGTGMHMLICTPEPHPGGTYFLLWGKTEQKLSSAVLNAKKFTDHFVCNNL